MDLSLFDMHCDTALEMFLQNKSFSKNDLALSLDKAEKYKNYCQTIAIWSDSRLDNEKAFEQFKKVYAYFNKDIANLPLNHSRSYIFAVEDARILNNDISRIDYLFSCDIKILTLVWSGVSCIGGAFDTDVSLTDFGVEVVKRCFELGIIPDVSHSSRKTTQKVFELSNGKYPMIASHSDSYSVNPHPRNITDEEFSEIKRCGGLVGINLYCEHLGTSVDSANAVDKVIDHIEHFLSLGGEDIVCFGCDFDGAQTPVMLKNISELYKIAQRMTDRGHSKETVNKLFWQNAEKFANKNFR